MAVMEVESVIPSRVVGVGVGVERSSVEEEERVVQD
jgi:hypothetical protein